MINIKSADLTNSTQKFIAGLALCAVLVILYFLLPPLVTIFANLWLLAILAVPMLFLIYNYEMIWELFKRMSWEMTKKIISSDKLWHMYQYYNYMLIKIAQLEENINSVKAIRSSTEKMVLEKIKELNNNISLAEKYKLDPAKTGLLKVTQSKVAVLQEQIDMFTPRVEGMKTQEVNLEQLCELWSTDTEILKVKLDAKAHQYESMKEIAKANSGAKAFLQGNSDELKRYNESIKQIEQEVNIWTAEIESFQRSAAPKIAQLATQSDINAEEGARLIEEYKAKRLNMAA